MSNQRKFVVNFGCQCCHAPLKIDSSFDPVTKDDVELFLGQSNELMQKSSSIDDVASLSYNDFFGEFQNDLDHSLMIKSQVFDLLSDLTEIDQPLCTECVEITASEVDAEISELNEQIHGYHKFLETLPKTFSDKVYEGLYIMVAELMLDDLQCQLREFHYREAASHVQANFIRTQEDRIAQIEREIDEICLKVNVRNEELKRLQTQRLCAEAELGQIIAHIEYLKENHTLDICFEIGVKENIPIINGYRLGRTSQETSPKDWKEISCALGFTAHLVQSLVNIAGITLYKYEIYPMVSQTYIRDKAREKAFPLFYNGGKIMFWNTKFDEGLVGLLDCAKQLFDHMEESTYKEIYPCRIKDDIISDVTKSSWNSIKLSKNHYLDWNAALKSLLVNLKCAISLLSLRDKNMSRTSNDHE